MKNKILLNIMLLAFCTFFFACEEEGDKSVIKDVSSNTLEPLSSSAFELLYDDQNDAFEEISWTKPDYGFQAAVTYTVEIARAGESFAGAFELLSTNTLTATTTVGELNSALLALGLTPEEPADVQVRVRAEVNPNIDAVYSSVLNLTITPFATTFPPIYIVGDAQGWNLANAFELQSTGPGTFEGIGTFQQNGKFRFFATPSWDAEQWRYSFFTGGTVDTELSDGADGDSNFLFNAASGYYKITVSLTSKIITIEASSAPTLFVIGDAQGWDLNNALELKSLGSGVFEGIGTFQQNGKFRFFGTPSWSADMWGYNYFSAGSVDSELADGADGDSNFIFSAASGVYKVTVSINDKTVTVESVPTPTLFIIGADQGWTLGNAVSLTWLGGGKYEGSATFTNNNTFRLFDKADWPNGFGNYPYFEEGEVSELLENANDGDSNFRFIGTTGTYTFTVDLYNLTVEMSQ